MSNDESFRRTIRVFGRGAVARRRVPVEVRRVLGCLLFVVVASVSITGCTATSMYKKAATIGVEIVGDELAEAAVEKEASALLGKPTAAADQRYGRPIRVMVDLRSQREVRVYPVDGDMLGNSRWVLESAGGRIDAISKAKVNPHLGKDAVKSAALDTLVEGKTPAEIERLEVVGRMLFNKPPRVLRSVPGGELIRVYDTTSHADFLGSRLVVLEFDRADRCTSIRFVGVPAARSSEK